MNILEIYKKYQIMPQLVEHQLRVAGVAEFILDHSDFAKASSDKLSTILDRHDVAAACLLHDMGNILKFDLTKSKSLLNQDIDVGFWQKVKEEYQQKYGANEHHASLEIARQAGASGRVVELIGCIGFSNGKTNAETKDFGKKICAYSDMRVGPLGVVSLEERLADLRVRYDGRFHLLGGNKKVRSEFENGLREIERQIFGKCSMNPEDIKEEAIAPIKEKLKSFEI